MKIEELIESELKSWDYSKNASDHDTTYFFLPSTSVRSSSFYNQQYFFEGIGVLRYISFILSQSDTEERRFPSLWPWIAAKLQPDIEVTISTHVLVSQAVFALSHTPPGIVDPNDYSIDLFGRLSQDFGNFSHSPLHQMAYCSDIKYGEQLFLGLDVVSRAPHKHPYFSSTLVHGVRDVLSGAISSEEFDIEYPLVSFNISLTWNPLYFTTQQGKILDGETILLNLSTSELLDIIDSWRNNVMNKDPILMYPIAMQARSIRVMKRNKKPSSSSKNNNNNINQFDKDITIENNEETITIDHNVDSIDEIQEKDIIDVMEKDNDIFLDISDTGETKTINDNHTILETNHTDDVQMITKFEAGDVVKVYVSRCASGFLPPESILEMFWELSFLTTIMALTLVGIVTYFTVGGIVHQLVIQEQIRLPFFIHLHENVMHLRFIYIWP